MMDAKIKAVRQHCFSSINLLIPLGNVPFIYLIIQSFLISACIKMCKLKLHIFSDLYIQLLHIQALV